MTWLSLKFETDARQVDLLSSTLLQMGALSVDIADANLDTLGEHEIFDEPGEPVAKLWRTSQVSGLFPADVNIARILRHASAALDLPATRCVVTELPEQDWVLLSQRQFEPIRITPRLWVVPSWHAAPDPGAVNIVLDPGLAFGTGSHPSTRLCLRWLDEHIKGGESVLDYGCGSGILAIAALKLGACRAFGVDCDPRAVLVSEANAEQNRVHAEIYSADNAPPIHADIVLANILANPLKLLAPLLADATRAGGALVLSGILNEQAREVEQTYCNWFDLHEAREQEGWVSLYGKKRLQL